MRALLSPRTRRVPSSATSGSRSAGGGAPELHVNQLPGWRLRRIAPLTAGDASSPSGPTLLHGGLLSPRSGKRRGSFSSQESPTPSEGSSHDRVRITGPTGSEAELGSSTLWLPRRQGAKACVAHASSYPLLPNGMRHGSPMADAFDIVARRGVTVFALADGCSWGPKAAAAALTAVRSFVDTVESQVDASTGKDFSSFLKRACQRAHDAILASAPDISMCGTCAFTGGLLSALEGSDNYVLACVNVGSNKVLHVDFASGHVTDVTRGSTVGRRNRDDPCGRLGPYVGDNGLPDLRNQACYAIECHPGDRIVLMTQGLARNFYPDALGRTPKDVGIPDAATWRDVDWKRGTHFQVVEDWFVSQLTALVSGGNVRSTKVLAEGVMDHVLQMTDPLRLWMQAHPDQGAPRARDGLPGHLDHMTCMAVEVGDPHAVSPWTWTAWAPLSRSSPSLWPYLLSRPQTQGRDGGGGGDGDSGELVAPLDSDRTPSDTDGDVDGVDGDGEGEVGGEEGGAASSSSAGVGASLSASDGGGTSHDSTRSNQLSVLADVEGTELYLNLWDPRVVVQQAATRGPEVDMTVCVCVDEEQKCTRWVQADDYLCLSESMKKRSLGKAMRRSLKSVNLDAGRQRDIVSQLDNFLPERDVLELRFQGHRAHWAALFGEQSVARGGFAVEQCDVKVTGRCNASLGVYRMWKVTCEDVYFLRSFVGSRVLRGPLQDQPVFIGPIPQFFVELGPK